jgi:hypothetical protein
MRYAIALSMSLLFSVHAYGLDCSHGFPATQHLTADHYAAEYGAATVTELQQAHEVLHSLLQEPNNPQTGEFLERQQVILYYLECAPNNIHASEEAIMAAIIAAEDPITADFSGEWYTYWGNEASAQIAMKLRQNGVEVVGSYEHRGGQVSGTVSGNVFSGTWYQSEDDGQGDFELTLNENGTQFSGRWRYLNNEAWEPDPWNGYR